MKLNELRLPDTAEEVSEVLKKYGYKRLGNESAYGMVFHKTGENSVLKLFSKRDKAYAAFVSLAIQHKSNPHFPRFARKVFEIKGTQYDAVKTELLTESVYPTTLASDMLKLRSYNTKADFEDDIYLKASWYNCTEQELKDKYKKWIEDNKELIEAFDIVKNFVAKSKGIALDIHSGNFMMRGDTVVIIDPVKPW